MDPNFTTFPDLFDQPGSKAKFGRLILNDSRSRQFPMRAIAMAAEAIDPKPRKVRKWRSYWQGNQGNTSQCTAYALLHFFEHGPISHPRSYGKYKKSPRPLYDPKFLYCKAQEIDPWPGGCDGQGNSSYDGTSVLAMLKVARELGLVASFFWEFENIQNVVNTVLYAGPVIVGTNWYRGMTYPNREGRISVTGPVVGGHAYLIDEVDVRSKNEDEHVFGVFNSWGPQWGLRGRAYIKVKDMERLMREDGEICIAEECK